MPWHRRMGLLRLLLTHTFLGVKLTQHIIHTRIRSAIAADIAALGNAGVVVVVLRVTGITLGALISAVGGCNRVAARAGPGIGKGRQRVTMIMAILLMLALMWIGPDGGKLVVGDVPHISCVLSSRLAVIWRMLVGHHWWPTVAVVLAMEMEMVWMRMRMMNGMCICTGMALLSGMAVHVRRHLLLCMGMTMKSRCCWTSCWQPRPNIAVSRVGLFYGAIQRRHTAAAATAVVVSTSLEFEPFERSDFRRFEFLHAHIAVVSGGRSSSSPSTLFPAGSSF
mmetsp:Transcript_12093/g.34584  ORF Transcript_12093/g.34584 Transcript_12093/m.34584 type:complete len:280 (-) Transcript_12093:37-876(-)